MAEMSDAVLNAIEQSAKYKIDHKQGEEQAIIYLDAWVALHIVTEIRSLREKLKNKDTLKISDPKLREAIKNAGIPVKE